MLRNLKLMTKRLVLVGLAVSMLAGCGNGKASSDAKKTSKKSVVEVAARDYCLLLFLPRVADELGLDVRQRVALAVWRPSFQRQLKTATQASGKSRSNEQLLADGNAELQQFGKRVEQQLTDGQKAAFRDLRVSRRISGMMLEQSPTGQIGVSYSVEKDLRQTQARFRFSDAMREISSVEDAAVVLGSDDNDVKVVAANWVLAHEAATLKQPGLVRDGLRSIVVGEGGGSADPDSVGASTHEELDGTVTDDLMADLEPAQRRAMVEAFCLLAQRDDRDVLLKLLESSPVDWEIARPAFQALIARAPDEASRLIRERLDNPVWRDESLALFEKMDRDAFGTLGLISDVLHPAWREPLRDYLRAAGRQTDDSVVTEFRIDWSVSQFDGGSDETRDAALRWFAAAAPADRFRDGRVVSRLRPMLMEVLTEEDRTAVVTAFSRWASADDIPVLVELVRDFDRDRDAAGLAVDALLRLEPATIGKLLGPPGKGDRFSTARNNPYSALVRERLGGPAEHKEAALIQLFEAPDERVRIAICRMLARTGGDRSEQFLVQQLKMKGLTEPLQKEIQRAVDRIRSR